VWDATAQRAGIDERQGVAKRLSQWRVGTEDKFLPSIPNSPIVYLDISCDISYTYIFKRAAQ
jgi:hypothetical protein